MSSTCSRVLSNVVEVLCSFGLVGWCRVVPDRDDWTHISHSAAAAGGSARRLACLLWTLAGAWAEHQQATPAPSKRRRPIHSFHPIVIPFSRLASPRLLSESHPSTSRAAARELAPALPTRAHRAAFALLPLVVSFVPTTGLDLRPHSHSPSGVPPSFAVCQPADPGPRRRETLDMASRAAQKRVGHHHGRGTWQPRSTRN